MFKLNDFSVLQFYREHNKTIIIYYYWIKYKILCYTNVKFNKFNYSIINYNFKFYNLIYGNNEFIDHLNYYYEY